MVENNAFAGLILVFISIIANAYWQDATRWANEKRKAHESEDYIREKAANTYKRNAVIIFRACTGLGFLTLISVLLPELPNTPMYISTETATHILLIVLGILALTLLYFTITPKYFVPIEYPEWVETGKR